MAAAGRLIPKGAGVEQLVSLISTGGGSIGTDGTGTAGAGQADESAVPQAALERDAQGRDEPPGDALRLGRGRADVV